MGKKEKTITISKEDYSKLYESLLNESKYSDVIIETKNGKIHGHLIILQNNSDHFKDVKANDTITFEEDESAIKTLLKFFYTGSYSLSKDEEENFKFLLNCYKVNQKSK
jgi:predicted CopG family antitoxin